MGKSKAYSTRSEVGSAGIEPTPSAPETDVLSIELRALLSQ